MKLIADSGATKSDWVLIDGARVVLSFSTKGYTPTFWALEDIAADLKASLPEGFPATGVGEVWFYGAGVTPAHEEPMASVLAEVFAGAEVHAASDTLGACRALLGDSAGFAAILGTGMNTCFFDGEKIAYKVAALGFILGDEGSGAYIGRRYVVDYLRGNMPDGVAAVAEKAIGLDMAGVIDRVYHQPSPNAWCAQFAKVVAEHMGEDSYYWNLVRACFDDFLWNVVSRYEDYERMELNCVGSVAYAFRDILELVANQYHMRIGKIIKAPMEGLVEYHSK